MAVAGDILHLDLKASKDMQERGEKFWNTSLIEMKFNIERSWIKSVRKADRKPNYGMLNMDSQLEEVVGNKLELVGPVLDSYLLELAKGLKSKLTRSKATGLVNPISLFIPWPIFRHILTLCRGYSGDVETTNNGTKHLLILTQMKSLKRMFSPARFSGQTMFATRHFKKVPSEAGGTKSVYNGKSLVVVTKRTPFSIDYTMKNQKASVSFYIQRYTADDFALDSTLQTLMNEGNQVV